MVARAGVRNATVVFTKKTSTVSAEYKHTTAPKSYRYLLRLMVSCDGLRIGWPLHKYDGLRLLHGSYNLETTLYIRTLYIITIQQEGLHLGVGLLHAGLR